MKRSWLSKIFGASVVSLSLTVLPFNVLASVAAVESDTSAQSNLQLAQVNAVSNLVEVAEDDSDLDTFSEMVETAGLENELSGNKDYTVFAPTDEAFDALPEGTVDELKKPENRQLLQDILTYHVAPGEINSDEIFTGDLDTLNGSVAIRRTPDNRVIVNDGSVVQADLGASNGTIHKINRVLLPRSLRNRVMALTVRPVRGLW